jgi:hypothetical protein
VVSSGVSFAQELRYCRALTFAMPLTTVWSLQVFLLLKSSDTVVHDLCHAFDNCEDAPEDATGVVPSPVLVLKKWSAEIKQ